MDAITPQNGRSGLTLSWMHPAGMIGLSIINFLLKIVTLGIYSFWAKTEVRKRIWSGIRINGEPLTYTGTGKELFLGFLIIFGAVLLPVFLLTFGVFLMLGPKNPAAYGFQALLYVFFIFLWGVAIYRAQRYRLSRTNWRGIRGSLVGSDMNYAWTFFWTFLLIPLTLGWIIPWRSTKLQSMVLNDTWLGDRPATFTAEAKPLYKQFAFAWIAVVIVGALVIAGIGGIVQATLLNPELDATPDRKSAFGLMTLLAIVLLYLFYAIVSAWYRAQQYNYFAENTRFEGANLRGTMTAGGLIWIAVTNYFIVLLSLGLLTPVAMARSARYTITNTAIEGTVPLASVSQGADQGIERGEGLAQAFDFDAF